MASDNTCGDCKLCCKLIGVDEVNKPTNTHCRHECAAGCAINDTKPNVCRAWLCAYRTNNWPPYSRPDKTGYIVISYEKFTAICFDPDEKEIWGADTLKYVKKLTRQKHPLVLCYGGIPISKQISNKRKANTAFKKIIKMIKNGQR